MAIEDSQIRQEGLKAFMRMYPQGVTIITTKVDDKPHGMTVSSFTSVSMDPPLILFAIDKSSNTYRAFTQAQIFAVNMLSADQAQLSELFGGRINSQDRFANVELEEDPSGAPLIRDAPAHLICRRYKTCDAGDHDLILCEVLKVSIKSRDFMPLVYRNKRYTTVLV